MPLRVVDRAWQLGLLLRAECLCGRVDVVHSTDMVLTPTRLLLVANLHDVYVVEMTDLHYARTVCVTAARLASMRRATVVIVDSQASADALSRVVDIATFAREARREGRAADTRQRYRTRLGALRWCPTTPVEPSSRADTARLRTDLVESLTAD